MTGYDLFAADLRSAARTIRGTSWPLEMGEWAEQLATRLDAYAAPGSPARVGLATEYLDAIGRAMADEHITTRTIERVMNRLIWGNPGGNPDTEAPFPHTCPHHGHEEGDDSDGD